VQVGQWTFVTASLASGVKRLTVDTSRSTEFVAGAAGAVTAVSGTLTGSIVATNSSVVVGENPVSDAVSTFTGVIDHVRVWAVARSERDLFSDKFDAVAPATGLLAGLGFSESSGLTTAVAGDPAAAAGPSPATLSASVKRVASTAPATGSPLQVAGIAGAATVISLKTDSLASSVFVTSLPSSGDLYQVGSGSGLGSPIKGVPLFVSSSAGQVVYVSAASATSDSFGFELRNSDGTLTSPATVALTLEPNRKPVANVGVYSLQLDGASGFVEVDNANGDFDSLSTFSVEVRVKLTASAQPKGTRSRSCIVSVVEGSSPRFALYLQRDFNVVLVQISTTLFEIPLDTVQASADGWTAVDSSLTGAVFSRPALPAVPYKVAVVPRTWQHWSLVITPTLVSVYLDGVALIPIPAKGLLQAAKPYAPLFAKKFRVGYTGMINPVTFDEDYLAATVDDLRFFSVARRAVDVNAAARALQPVDGKATVTVTSTSAAGGGSTSTTLPLYQGLWSFDETGGGLLAYDASTFSRTAEMRGGVSRIESDGSFGRAASAPGLPVDFSLSGFDPDGNAIASANITAMPNPVTEGKLYVLTIPGGAPGGTRRMFMFGALQSPSSPTVSTSASRGLTVTTLVSALPWYIPNPSAVMLRFVPFASLATSSLALSYTVSDGSLQSSASEYFLDIACPAGFAPVDRNGTSSCSPCSPGFFAPAAGLSSCLPCAAGTFASAPGATSCTTCAGGSASPMGSTACTVCAAGTAAVAGDATCVACLPGFVAPVNGTSECSLCPIESYSNSSGTVTCTPCPAGSENRYAGKLPALSASDCECSRGFFSPGSTRGSACTRCPAGASCPGGVVLPSAGAGFYSPAGANASLSTTTYLACPNPAACPGGSACRAPYTGPLCASCAKGYYRLELRCVKCPKGPEGLFVLFWIGFAALLYVCLLAGRYGKRLLRFSPSAGLATSAGIFIGFLQAVVLMFRYQIGWPEWYHKYMASISFVNFNVESIAVECSPGWKISRPIERAFPLFIPPIALGIYALGFVVGTVWTAVVAKKKKPAQEPEARPPQSALVPSATATAKEKEKEREKERERERAPSSVPLPRAGDLAGYVKYWFASGLADPVKPKVEDYLNGFVVFLLYAYFFLVEASLNAFHCQRQPSGRSTWTPDPTVYCFSDKWRPTMAGYMVGLAVYGLGIPVFAVWVLFRHGRSGAADLYAPDRIRERVGAPLWLPFRRGVYWWVLVRLARKALFVFSIVVWSGNTRADLPLFLTAFVVVVAIALQALVKPYRHALNNHMELLTLLGEALLVFAAMLYHSASGSAAGTFPEAAFRRFLGVFVGIVAFGAFSLILAHLVLYLVAARRPIPKDRETSELLQAAEILKSIAARPNALEYYYNYTGDDERLALIRALKSFEELTSAFDSMGVKQFVSARETRDPEAGTILGLAPAAEVPPPKDKKKEDKKDKKEKGKEKEKEKEKKEKEEAVVDPPPLSSIPPLTDKK
jgi:hypothetical protein